jgi:GNAT superfamily N-acetyltransferase
MYAAFLSTLRANLAIDLESPPPSLCNTPDLRPINFSQSTTSLLPPPSPSPLSFVEDASLTQDDGTLTQLQSAFTTSPAITEDDKVEVLHLVADSVAQQRHHAFMAIMCHPTSIVTILLLLATFCRRLITGVSTLWTTALSFIGLLLVFSGALRLLTMGYIQEAESIGTWSWLEKDLDSAGVIGDDEMFLARSRDGAPVGALIIRGARQLPSLVSPNGTGIGQRKRRQNSKDKNAPIGGLIRGWTVQPKYRRQGIGAELLEEAIRLCQQRGWTGPEIDPEHANSKRHLPKFFAKSFDLRDAQARLLLERTKEDMGISYGSSHGKRRR